MADNVVTRSSVVSYSGLLYDKGSNKRPFFSSIMGRRRVSGSKDFVTGQFYTTPAATEQKAISEIQSLTAPDANFVTRTQMKNCTQIFHESVYISYAKMSDTTSLAGLNVAGQTANPSDERAFQIGVTMDYIANQIEYSFVNGVYQEATNDTVAGKTRGIIAAITTNVIEKTGTPELKYWDLIELMSKITQESNASGTDLTIMLNNVNFLQLVKNATENGLSPVQEDPNANGVVITRIITPYGTLSLMINEYVPAGTVVVVNLGVCGPVENVVPKKGNFFYEELAKTGAGEKGQIFGQMGLDHGPEWFHGKITGLATTFTAPTETV